MQKTILTALVAALIAASTAQIAAAREHHPRHHRMTHGAVAAQFRNANNAVPAPAQPGTYSDYWSNFSEGHINMVGH